MGRDDVALASTAGRTTGRHSRIAHPEDILGAFQHSTTIPMKNLSKRGIAQLQRHPLIDHAEEMAQLLTEQRNSNASRMFLVEYLFW